MSLGAWWRLLCVTMWLELDAHFAVEQAGQTIQFHFALGEQLKANEPLCLTWHNLGPSRAFPISCFPAVKQIRSSHSCPVAMENESEAGNDIHPGTGFIFFIRLSILIPCLPWDLRVDKVHAGVRLS